MGTLVGHVAPGLGFLLIGLWHLLNNIKFHSQNPKSYTSLPWFPTSSSRLRYLELYSIIFGCLASISMELFIGPEKHQPLDPDFTIPSNHLHNFEHSNISLTFLLYAIFSIILDKFRPPAHYGLTLILAAIAFGQQLLLFHLHSADHMGIEGQYHWLLQIVIFVSLVTTLLGIGYPNSFLNGFVRSFSILFQGVWFIVMGFMLWTPEYIPKDCFLNLEEGHHVVRCHSHEAVERAKSLVNISFSWYLVGVTIFCLSVYLVMTQKMLPENVVPKYQSLTKFEDEHQQEEEGEDVEAQKRASFLPVGKSFGSLDIER